MLLGTYVIGKDPHFDPFCVWGNEISMNQHQVRKLIKIVSKMSPKMAIKLFVYTLSKTTTNYRMVSKNPATCFLLPIMSCVRWQCLNLFPLQWLPKQFTQDYLSKYMIGGHAKVKVFLPEHDDYLDVFMKTWRMGGRPSQGVGLESCVPSTWRRAQYGHSASPCSATRIYFASFFTVFNSASIQLWFIILYLVLM